MPIPKQIFIDTFMNWLTALFTSGSIANDIIALAVVIAVGVFLTRIKIGGIGIGITWILFAGIVFGHFGLGMSSQLLGFVKEFGLILFVCSIGLQVGPSFFSLFKADGLKLNLLAVSIVGLGVITATVIYFVSGLPIETMVGIMSGAITNTPSLGAATQTFSELKPDAPVSSIALGYAAAYPMGVIGVLLSMIVFEYVFKKMGDSSAFHSGMRDSIGKQPERITIEIKNAAIDGKEIRQIMDMISGHFVISRINKNGEMFPPSPDTKLNIGDKILLIANEADIPFFVTFFGVRAEFRWRKIETQIEEAKFMVSDRKLEGKSLMALGLFGATAFNITRVNRAGTELVAHADLKLQVGDRLTVVGSKEAIGRVEKIVGNSIQMLQHPNLFPLFLSVVLGVILGSLPIWLPGVPQPMKLGLAGGPLIVAILIGYFGPKIKLSTYTSSGANLMARELGIAMFLAAVGIGAGKEFFSTVFSANGLNWVLMGSVITIIPSVSAFLIGRFLLKLDYYTILGVLSGSTTNPPALAYSNSVSPTDAPAVGYATVYPLSMFLRVLTAQLMILLFL